MGHAVFKTKQPGVEFVGTLDREHFSIVVERLQTVKVAACGIATLTSLTQIMLVTSYFESIADTMTGQKSKRAIHAISSNTLSHSGMTVQ